jgi:hypothetical protein
MRLNDWAGMKSQVQANHAARQLPGWQQQRHSSSSGGVVSPAELHHFASGSSFM